MEKRQLKRFFLMHFVSFQMYEGLKCVFGKICFNQIQSMTISATSSKIYCMSVIYLVLSGISVEPVGCVKRMIAKVLLYVIDKKAANKLVLLQRFLSKQNPRKNVFFFVKMQLDFVISILNQTYIPAILLLNQRGKEQLQGRNGAKMLPLEKKVLENSPSSP